MAENILEILSVDAALAQDFTITAANEVSVNSAAGLVLLENVGGDAHFSRKDNVLLLGVGVQIPYAYCMGTEPFKLRLRWVRDDGEAFIAVNDMIVPVGNTEIPLFGGQSRGFFVEFPTWTPDTGEARLELLILSGKISLINNPTALTGDIPVLPWARIQHTIPLYTPS